MSHYVVKVDRREFICRSCDGCGIIIRSVYFLIKPKTNRRVWTDCYCVDCTAKTDVVYEYYLETADPIMRTFYDLETLAWYYPHLVPKLKKI